MGLTRKYKHALTVHISEELHEFIMIDKEMLGISTVAEYIRYLVEKQQQKREK